VTASRFNPKRVAEAFSRLAAIAVVQVSHRRLDIGVPHPRLDLHDVRPRDRE